MGTEVSDEVKLILNPREIPVKYQTLTNFDEKESYIVAEYESILNSLAFILKGNPDYAIQLIGHSGDEGTEEENYDLSVQRAENIKAYLVSQGAGKNQIEIRGEGFHKPLYYLQLSDWQKKYNRRVEIRWLDPELKPYEIKAAIFESEEEALKSTKEWEDKGYQAYYDRYIIDNNPMYQVRLWGYASRQEAENVAKEIVNEYNKKVSVE